MSDKLVSEPATTGHFSEGKRLLVGLLVTSLICMDTGGCARLRVVEKETHDPATDTYTYKFKKLPEWSEYALGTLVGAVWGVLTLGMLVPVRSKPKPKPEKTNTLEQEQLEKAEAKVDYMLNTNRENGVQNSPR